MYKSKLGMGYRTHSELISLKCNVDLIGGEHLVPYTVTKSEGKKRFFGFFLLAEVFTFLHFANED